MFNNNVMVQINENFKKGWEGYVCAITLFLGSHFTYVNYK
jgi:hypothetical protein